MKLLKITLPIFILILILSSCGNDDNEETETPTASASTTIKPKRKIFNPEQLIGKWVVTDAMIDRVPTPRLDSAYFEFVDGNILKTNVLGSDEQGTYSLEDKKMTQKTAKTIEYQIQKLVGDSLIMSMKVGRKKFRVLLQK